MQTVNFNCSHCAKLMAVGVNLLGRNVRCPHCKQVVEAPATPKTFEQAPPAPVIHTQPPPAPLKQTVPPPSEGQESIFGETTDDDLFGRPQKSQVQFADDFAPPPPPPPQRAFNDPTRTAPIHSFPSAPASPFSADATRTLEVQPPPPSNPPEPWRNREPVNELPTEQFTDAGLDHEDEARAEERPIASRPPARSGGGGMFVWMLLFYSLVATGAAAYLFYEKTQLEEQHDTTKVEGKEHPYLSIPDFFGQYDRAERKKPAKIDGMPAASLSIPEPLQMRLNETKNIGDLEVTPLRVELRRPTRFRTRDGVLDKSEAPGAAYLLHLRLKNTSNDVYFHPTDPVFNRHQMAKAKEPPIYTGLNFGPFDPQKGIRKEFLMGGPFEWPDEDNSYLEGQENDRKALAPQEVRDYVIASRFAIDTKKIEEHKSEPIMWRVQLRRGLERVKDDAGNERDISVSSIIGVHFDHEDIHN